jgi:hypothetical protein
MGSSAALPMHAKCLWGCLFSAYLFEYKDKYRDNKARLLPLFAFEFI